MKIGIIPAEIMRIKMKFERIILLALTTALISYSFAVESIEFNGDGLKSITIQKPALYPEGIDYNPITDRFIVGSFRDGGVYEVNLDGSYHQLIDDKRLNSVLAVRVDAARNKLFVVNSDIGSSINHYSKGPKKLASLGIYELSTGRSIDFINLGDLSLTKTHLANGMTLDSDGNVYVTDSFSPTIYKIDSDGHASIFLENDRFLGDGINLNGIVFHPDGYLIAVKKGEGVLFKIPLNKPQAFTEIHSTEKFIGGDGLVLINNNELVVIANRANGKVTETVFTLNSRDNWQSAKITKKLQFGKVYLTTGVIRKGSIYVMHSNLKALMLAPSAEKGKLNVKATIQQIGRVH